MNPPPRNRRTLRIFISSTSEDLVNERSQVLEGVLHLHFEHVAMEYFGADPRKPIEVCLDEVRRSDVYLGIIGHRYGTIVEETGKTAKNSGFARVGLFGTKFTMEADFYSNVLCTKYSISVVTPGKADQDYIHCKIMTELVNGCIVEETRQELSRIARNMADKEGIEALILGCTELSLILSEKVVGIPVLDTTRIHAEAALNFSQSGNFQE